VSTRWVAEFQTGAEFLGVLQNVFFVSELVCQQNIWEVAVLVWVIRRKVVIRTVQCSLVMATHCDNVVEFLMLYCEACAMNCEAY